ncbi:MAG: hypothetical protein LBS64_03805 [Spirochaetaceae bacterium]|jgi:hypothetical protein|nr:hypothetical protein [Spirochaetaceae bacterium]
MKKICIFMTLVLSLTWLHGVSWTDNEFQVLANRYNQWAVEAFNQGDYEKSIDYAALAKENAALSQSYVEMMLRKTNAEHKIRTAQDRMRWAESAGAPENFADAYRTATENLAAALAEYDGLHYDEAAKLAQRCVDTLGVVIEVSLPRFYVVRVWKDSGDCFWNIAGKSFVFNNPHLWRELYEANRSKLPKPSNPDLIAPGTVLEIPSRSGEMRSGTYDPGKTWDTYGEK